MKDDVAYLVDVHGEVWWEPDVDDFIFIREEELDLRPSGGD
jgi:hypothetical protein